MPSRIDARLSTVLQTLAARHPTMKLPFIVTLAHGAKAADVLPFVPTLEVPTIRMLAGEMTAAEALALAKHARVERIEHDGQAETLEALARRE